MQAWITDGNVGAHVERHVGPVDFTLHEIGTGRLPVAVHHVAPGPGRSFHTLVTSGMSGRAMRVPPGYEGLRYAELFLLLSPEWRFDGGALSERRWSWPIARLRELARHPHERDTWVGSGHALPDATGDEAFRASLLTCPVSLAEGFGTLRRENGCVHFYQVVPLYEEELGFALAHTPRALVARFCQYALEDVVVPGRRNVCVLPQRGRGITGSTSREGWAAL